MLFSRRSKYFRNDEVKMHLDRCPAVKWKTQLVNGLVNGEIVSPSTTKRYKADKAKIARA